MLLSVLPPSVLVLERQKFLSWEVKAQKFSTLFTSNSVRFLFHCCRFLDNVVAGAVQAYHRKFPDSMPERPEAEQMLNTLDISRMVQFSGEESYGRYLDLHLFYSRCAHSNSRFLVYLD